MTLLVPVVGSGSMGAAESRLCGLRRSRAALAHLHLRAPMSSSLGTDDRPSRVVVARIVTDGARRVGRVCRARCADLQRGVRRGRVVGARSTTSCRSCSRPPARGELMLPDAERIVGSCSARYGATPMAKACLEMAVLDAGAPRSLGARSPTASAAGRERVDAGAVVGLADPTDTEAIGTSLERSNNSARRDITRVKVKIAPGADLEHPRRAAPRLSRSRPAS